MFSELLLELWCWTCHLVDRHMKSGVLTLTPRENRESSEYILKSSKNTIFNEHQPALMQIILLAYCVSQQIENRDFWIVSCNCKTAENKKIKLSHVKRWLLEKWSLLPCCQFNRSFYSGDWGSSASSQRDEGVHLDEPRGKTQYVFIFHPRMYFAWEDRNVKKGTIWDDCPLEIHLIKWWLYFGCFKPKEIVIFIIVIKKDAKFFSCCFFKLSIPFFGGSMAAVCPT